MSPFPYGSQLTGLGFMQVCTGTTGHAEACKFEYDPEKLDFGDMACFPFISPVCYKHAPQAFRVDLTNSGVLPSAYTKLNNAWSRVPSKLLGCAHHRLKKVLCSP